MDIGTGKDLEEYIVNGTPIEYHLIDIKDPGYKYNIAEFQQDFNAAFLAISQKGKRPILCGGSGLYLDTALYGNSFLGIPSDDDLWKELKSLSPDAVEKMYLALPASLKMQLSAETLPRKIRAIEIHRFLDLNPEWENNVHININSLVIGIKIDREIRRQKISNRLAFRLENGLIEEVESLLENELTHEDLEYYGLEYKWVGKYILGEIDKKTLFERLEIAIHQFAKRQMTWFRRMEKNGTNIHWIDANLSIENKLAEINQLIN